MLNCICNRRRLHNQTRELGLNLTIMHDQNKKFLSQKFEGNNQIVNIWKHV